MDDYTPNGITSPGEVIAELERLMRLSQKGINAQYEAEVKYAAAEMDYDLKYSKELLLATGTQAEKVAIAKIESAESRFAADVAKAELNRVKAKLKSIESAQVSVSVISRQVELQWRNA